MNKRLFVTVMLIVYSVILVKLLLFKDLPLIKFGHMVFSFGGTHEGPANLIPFKTIWPYLIGEKGFLIAGLNIGGNIALLVPIGLMVPFIFRNLNWKKMLLLAFASGFFIEGMQVLLHVGIFDIDDVMLNGLGVMVGYWMFLLLAKLSRPVRSKIIIATTLIVMGATAAFYGFFIYPKSEKPLRLGPGFADGRLPDSTGLSNQHILPDSSNVVVGLTSGKDPCNGTGGTGRIIAVGTNDITIKRNDGTDEMILFTDKTNINNSAGPVKGSDLKIGNRVTVVVMSEHTATAILVCNARNR